MSNAYPPEWTRSVTIVCPACQASQDAEIEKMPDEPFPRYVHVCESCDYIIMESEWEEVKDA